MTNSYFHIVEDNIVILSNLPKELLPEFDTCEAETKCLICPIKNTTKRQKRIKSPSGKGYIYFCTYETDMTKKTFAYYFDALCSMYEAFCHKIIENKTNSTNLIKSDIHRLQHNVNTYNAKIQDDINSLIALEDIKMSEWNTIVPFTTDIIQNNPKKAALVLLKTSKNISLINAEMNVYDFIEDPSGEIQLYAHNIHKVIKLSLQPFFLDFYENRIRPKLGECRELVKIDYASISVVLGHLWSNAVKYTYKDTDIDISFNVSDKFVDIVITSYSLAIETNEISKVLEEGYSGKWSKHLNKSGNGIGMFYIKYLTELNNGQFDIQAGKSFNFVDRVPYTTNKFILRLCKA